MKRISILVLFFILVLLFVGLLYSGTPSKLVSDAQIFFLFNVLPSGEKLTVTSSTSYSLSKSQSGYIDVVAADLGVFSNEGVYTNNINPGGSIRIQKLNIVFVDESQHWPLIFTRSGTLSSFSLDISNSRVATLKIWLNTEEIDINDKNTLSLIANRSVFMALYTMSRWTTVDYFSDHFLDFLERIDNELKYLEIDERPIVITQI